MGIGYYLFEANRISQYENDGVTPQKHLDDVSVLVDRLSLLFALSRSGKLGPHFFDVFKIHVAMSVESFDSAQKLFVISAVDENLGVVFDGLSENRQRSCVEFFLFSPFEFLGSHF